MTRRPACGDDPRTQRDCDLAVHCGEEDRVQAVSYDVTTAEETDDEEDEDGDEEDEEDLPRDDRCGSAGWHARRRRLLRICRLRSDQRSRRAGRHLRRGGNDVLAGGRGQDRLFGGEGRDRAAPQAPAPTSSSATPAGISSTEEEATTPPRGDGLPDVALGSRGRDRYRLDRIMLPIWLERRRC